MVYLSRIYTRSGDGGETGLGDGSRVPKDHPRVRAYGSVDELNALLGLVVAHFPTDPALAEQRQLLGDIQNDLFDVGADLCYPASAQGASEQPLRLLPHQVERLEQAIDRCTDRLQPLTSFVLPGGTPAAAWCHLARTVCRRTERELVALQRTDVLNPQLIIYLNRLSDWLFVLARVCNGHGQDDILWVPGKNRSS